MVWQLVPYETGSTTSELSQSMGYFGSSEYNDIDTSSLISSKQESEARAFVSKVEQFVVRLNEQLNDSQLSDDNLVQNFDNIHYRFIVSLLECRAREGTGCDYFNRMMAFFSASSRKNGCVPMSHEHFVSTIRRASES